MIAQETARFLGMIDVIDDVVSRTKNPECGFLAQGMMSFCWASMYMSESTSIEQR
jgi:hypothetical protein